MLPAMGSRSADIGEGTWLLGTAPAAGSRHYLHGCKQRDAIYPGLVCTCLRLPFPWKLVVDAGSTHVLGPSFPGVQHTFCRCAHGWRQNSSATCKSPQDKCSIEGAEQYLRLKYHLYVSRLQGTKMQNLQDHWGKFRLILRHAVHVQPWTLLSINRIIIAICSCCSC